MSQTKRHGPSLSLFIRICLTTGRCYRSALPAPQHHATCVRAWGFHHCRFVAARHCRTPRERAVRAPRAARAIRRAPLDAPAPNGEALPVWHAHVVVVRCDRRVPPRHLLQVWRAAAKECSAASCSVRHLFSVCLRLQYLGTYFSTCI